MRATSRWRLSLRPLRLPRPPVLAAAQADNKETTLDQYLNSVTKDDPSVAPFFLGFRQTENAAVLKPGMDVGIERR
jgi:hypothetical protein